MSTHSIPHAATRPEADRTARVSPHWTWLLRGLAVGFVVPYVLTDLLDLNRDLFYGLYALAVAALVAAWARSTGYDLAAAVRRRWPVALALGVLCAGLLTIMVVRAEDATTRPDGIQLAAAVLWRGVLYGATDGLLLSAFPILVVFGAFAGSRLRQGLAGTLVVGAVALLASLAMTAVYHAGYSDFRSTKVARPIAGDVVWSIPTLLTLNPIGAPIAHAGMHVSAVLHSYETETFLPPHK
jgi:hypothetical protein